MKGKGGKAFKKTTSKGRKMKRLRGAVRWPKFNAESLGSELTNKRRVSGAIDEALALVKGEA